MNMLDEAFIAFNEIIFNFRLNNNYKNHVSSNFGDEEIFLPSKSVSKISELIHKRKTERISSSRYISFEDLGNLLSSACGVVDKSARNYRYTVPMAGGVRELRLMVVIRNVSDIQKCGVYEFIPERNSIVFLPSLSGEYFFESWEQNAAISIIFMYPINDKNRSYENNLLLACFEAGCICQNVYLLSTELGLSCCISGVINAKEISAHAFGILPLQSISVSRK